MGTWGPGLYSDDFALDLKTSISAVWRLPLDADEIVRILAELNPAAYQPDDEDHTTFWLVVADQLQRKGLESEARERARRIIDDGTNIAVPEQLGMSSGDLRQRA